MSRCRIDHLVVTAPSLEAGRVFVQRALGVSPQPGGEHVLMGTHNLLLHLGESLYLEVMAINPAVPVPSRPRWFGLDRGNGTEPKLAAWVVRSEAIGATAAKATEELGEIEPMSRGSLNWLITIPADGSLPLGGAAPALIEWHTKTHPAAGLADHDLALARLDLFHPDPERITRLLRSIDLDGPVCVSAAASAGLAALMHTPRGPRKLGHDNGGDICCG